MSHDELFDDMPPLEYVGPCNEVTNPLRPGDLVTLQGLQSTELNGQRGNVLPFTDVARAGKGRLGVRLLSGREVSIRHQNLVKVDSTDQNHCSGNAGTNTASVLDHVPECTSKQSEFHEGDHVTINNLEMQEYNGKTGVILKAATDSEEHGGIVLKLLETHKKLTLKKSNLKKNTIDAPVPVSIAKPQRETSSEDLMAPLRDEFAVQQKNSSVVISAPEDAASDDSMPPFTTASQPQPMHKNLPPVWTCDDASSDDSMPPLHEAKPIVPAQSGFETVEHDSVFDDSLLLLRNSPLSESQLAQTGKLSTEEINNAASDDSMPILRDTGDASAECTRLPVSFGKDVPANDVTVDLDAPVNKAAERLGGRVTAEIGSEVESDDSMPPLRMPPGIETSVTREIQVVEADTVQDCVESDASMPPLRYVGSSVPAETTKLSFDSLQDDESDDSMPPLRCVSTSLPAEPIAAKAQDAASHGVPPLQCTGNSATLVPAETTKLSVDSGQDDESDDSMPPLRYVGNSLPAEPVRAKAQDAASDGMPPLQYMGKGATVSLQGLQPHAEGPGAKDDFASDDSMPPLYYVGDAAREDEDHTSTRDGAERESESDDSMPPLMHKRDSAKTSAKAMPITNGEKVNSSFEGVPPWTPIKLGSKQNEGGDHTNEPSTHLKDALTNVLQIENTAVKPVGRNSPVKVANDSIAGAFSPGDLVILKGLTATNLNGQRATVLPRMVGMGDGRVPVRLTQNPTRVLVRIENIDKVPPDDTQDGTAEGTKAQPSKTKPSLLMQQPGKVAASLSPSIGGRNDPSVENQANLPSTANLLDQARLHEPDPENVVAAHGLDDQLNIGDKVILKDLTQESLNGQFAVIAPVTSNCPPERLVVRLLSTGQRFSVKVEKVEKVVVPLKPDDSLNRSQLGWKASSEKSAQTTPARAVECSSQTVAQAESLPHTKYSPTMPSRKVPASVQTSASQVRTLPEHPPKLVSCLAAQPLLHSTDSLEGKVRVQLEDGRWVRLPSQVLNTADLESSSRDDTESSKLDLMAENLDKDVARNSTESAANALVERMQEAAQCNSKNFICDVVAEVEGSRDVAWGQLLPRKKQLLKKLQAKKRKLEQEGAAESAKVMTLESKLHAPVSSVSAISAISEASSDSRASGLSSKRRNPTDGNETVWGRPVLDHTLSLQEWCDMLTLPPEFMQRLREEDVCNQRELAYIPYEDLVALARGLKAGPKGRFLGAVQNIRL